MKLSIKGRKLHIDLSFWESVWSVKKSWSIPLKNIVKVKKGAPRTSWKELRAPGTFFPGVIKAGTYYTPRGKEFWYVRKIPGTIIELKNEKYKRLVLSLPEKERKKFNQKGKGFF